MHVNNLGIFSEFLHGAVVLVMTDVGGVGIAAGVVVHGSEEVARRLAADGWNSSRAALEDGEDSPLQSKRSST